VPAGRGAVDGYGEVDELAEPRLLVVAAGRAAAVGLRIETWELHAQYRRLQLVQPRVVAHVLVGDLVARTWKRSIRTRSASASSTVVIAPPSPKQPRFFDGKKLNVAIVPRAQGRPAAVVEPAACAASSITGTPSASISATGATLPNRWTAITALVRGVSAACTESGVTQNVAGSTSQNTGRAPVGGIASALA